ncbi:cobalamin-dependent protein [Pseudomonas sp. RIT-PI-AD]|uniref:cobalamin B12-binding domain-containing protein n=1 Tax=Pseudomonas sp. RIT-PI-AD TaxID=3035294 RepID=UPI0021D8C7C2|nr:cobalamin-dependent protein [Pseudomonas sp. RIT-PI-AD]
MTVTPQCVIATVESDSHMWNLVYLQLWLAEHGFAVKNLGSCTPVDDVLAALDRGRPNLLVISSVNGHGYAQGKALIRQVRRLHPDLPCVIGGKLTTSEEGTLAVQQELVAAGFTEVFVGPDAIEAFGRFLDTLRGAQAHPALTVATAQTWG